MIVEAAVLVVGDEERRVAPVRAGEQGVDQVGDRELAALDVRRWMLVVLRVDLTDVEGIDEGDLRQQPRGRVDRILLRGEQVPRAVQANVAVERGERHFVEIDLPRNPGVVQPVEDRQRGVIGRAGREVVPHVPEGRRRQLVETVRERLIQGGREVRVADREVVVEVVVEGQVGLVVVTHGPMTCGIGRYHVLLRETVHQAVVPFVVGARPRMVQVADLAVVGLVERRDDPPVGSRIPRRRLGFHRKGRVVRPEMTEEVVEGSVLLHQHDDVIELVERGGGADRAAAEDRAAGHDGNDDPTCARRDAPH